MNAKQFISETLNKWVKIENNETTIIQNIHEYRPTPSKNRFDCSGFSISNCEGEVIELNNFYMTDSHLKGKITELSEESAEKEIQAIKQSV